MSRVGSSGDIAHDEISQVRSSAPSARSTWPASVRSAVAPPSSAAHADASRASSSHT
jgi:hypothetical protein